MSEVRGSVANAHAFVQRLIDLGLKHAVLSPGSRNAPISITLAKAAEQGLISLHVRIDEREAAFFALGLGKTSDIPALLCCTSGTAAVNFAPAVVEAADSRVPMLVLTADRPTGAAARGASQSIEQEHMFAPHSIANLSVSEHADANAAADRARIAWNASRGAKRGAAHVNMHLTEPLLVPTAQWPQLLAPTVVDVPGPADEAFIAPMPINFGERPVFIIGDLPQHETAAAHAALTIARELRVPVLMEPTAGTRDSSVAIRHHTLVTDAFLKEATCVISLGRFGLGRHLRRLCEQVPTHIAFAAYGSGADPYATADVTLPAGQLAAALADMSATEPSWLQKWRDADDAAHNKLDSALREWAEQPTGIHIAQEVLAAARAHDAL
ncbi:MAG: 2-succinyl-5-enolpyruvyl-6-hydroxy-3-cyclohexene-1-carboxylic-acid synthase, partial [Actinomycetes bacterium]